MDFVGSGRAAPQGCTQSLVSAAVVRPGPRGAVSARSREVQPRHTRRLTWQQAPPPPAASNMAPSSVDTFLLPALGGALFVSSVAAVVRHFMSPKPRQQQPGASAKATKAKKKDKGKPGKARGGDAPAAQQQKQQRQTVVSAPQPAASQPPPAAHKAVHSAPAASQSHGGSAQPAVGGAAGGKVGAALPRAAPASQAPVAAPRSPPKSASVPPTHRAVASLNSTESDTDGDEGEARDERPAAVPQGAVAAVPSGVVSGEPDDSWQVRQTLLLRHCQLSRVWRCAPGGRRAPCSRLFLQASWRRNLTACTHAHGARSVCTRS